MSKIIVKNYHKIPNRIYELGLKPAEMVLLEYLIYMTANKATPFSRETACQKCGIKSVRTFDKILKKLSEKKLVKYNKGWKNVCSTYSVLYRNIDPDCAVNKKNVDKEIKDIVSKSLEFKGNNFIDFLQKIE